MRQKRQHPTCLGEVSGLAQIGFDPLGVATEGKTDFGMET